MTFRESDTLTGGDSLTAFEVDGVKIGARGSSVLADWYVSKTLSVYCMLQGLEYATICALLRWRVLPVQKGHA